ncbi:hypothetical protein QL285_007645 [Trifolium repens]|nr:hypothetical protein QL285_007645 [Trifolium repens]
MSSNQLCIQGPSLGDFVTIHLQKERYGEIDPEFFQQLNNYQFATTWKLIDSQGKCHKVKFNGDYCHPLFTNGWHSLRKKLSIQGNAKIMISYYGDNIFKVVVGPQITTSQLIPPYHSRSTMVGETIYFDHCIDDKTNLIFPPNMQEYIKQHLSSSEFLVLCGKQGKKLDGTINNDYSDQPHIYIGREWNLFCYRNKLKLGDIIRFKFARVFTSHMVHVYKIDI